MRQVDYLVRGIWEGTLLALVVFWAMLHGGLLFRGLWWFSGHGVTWQ